MSIEFTTEIRCPPKQLWPWLTEPERMKRWMKGLVSIEPVDSSPMRVGARAKMTIKEGRKEVVYDEQVLEWEPMRRVLVSLTAPHCRGVEIVTGNRLEDLGNATRLHYTCEFRSTSTLFKLLGWLFSLFARMQAKSFLKSLKRLAEITTA